MSTAVTQLPLPPFFEPNRVGEVWRVPYEARAAEAAEWARRHAIPPAANDKVRICLMPIDCQMTFCVPDFELFVGGRSGKAGVAVGGRSGTPGVFVGDS